jgi:SAM-dependent methyltransferase
MTAATRQAPAVPYRLNESPYGCHALLLNALTREGQGRRVLDVGCCNGYFSQLLAGRGFEVTGIDQHAGHAGSFPQDVRLVEHDLNQGLPRLEGRFSYIVCADVLEHLRDPSALLRDLVAMLEPGGRVLASLPNSGNLYFRLVILSGRFPKHDRGLFDRTHLHFLVWKEWISLFADAGLAVESVQSSSLPFTLVFSQPGLRFLARGLEWCSFVLARVWKNLFAYQFVITAVRK